MNAPVTFADLSLVGLLLPDVDRPQDEKAPARRDPLFVPIDDAEEATPTTKRGRRYAVAIVVRTDPTGARIVFTSVQQARRAAAALRDLPAHVLQAMWSYIISKDARPYKESFAQ